MLFIKSCPRFPNFSMPPAIAPMGGTRDMESLASSTEDSLIVDSLD
ncbi:hypothetical protein [Pelistega ratti]|nr:hypothetical protein [Pelistega ratti]